MNSPPDFILARDELARGIRYRAPHVVPNPSDCYVYGLADELAAEGYVTAREVPDLDARIWANTLAAPEDDDEGDEDTETALTADQWQWFTSAPTPAGTWHVFAPDLEKGYTIARTPTPEPVATGTGPWLVTCPHTTEGVSVIRCTTAADTSNVVRALVAAGLSPQVSSP